MLALIPCPEKGGANVYTTICNDKSRCTYKKCKNYGAAPMHKKEDPGTMRYCIYCKNYNCESEEEPCRACLDTDPPGRERPAWQENAHDVDSDINHSATAGELLRNIEVIDSGECHQFTLNLEINQEKPDGTLIQLNLF